jgi:hypothetical protein
MQQQLQARQLVVSRLLLSLLLPLLHYFLRFLLSPRAPP